MIYLKADVIGCEVRSKDGNRRAVHCSSSGICSVIPFYNCVEKTLTLNYQVGFACMDHYLLPESQVTHVCNLDSKFHAYCTRLNHSGSSMILAVHGTYTCANIYTHREETFFNNDLYVPE